jgi:hypothetical protein
VRRSSSSGGGGDEELEKHESERKPEFRDLMVHLFFKEYAHNQPCAPVEKMLPDSLTTTDTDLAG